MWQRLMKMRKRREWKRNKEKGCSARRDDEIAATKKWWIKKIRKANKKWMRVLWAASELSVCVQLVSGGPYCSHNSAPPPLLLLIFKVSKSGSDTESRTAGPTVLLFRTGNFLPGHRGRKRGCKPVGTILPCSSLFLHSIHLFWLNFLHSSFLRSSKFYSPHPYPDRREEVEKEMKLRGKPRT